MKLLLMQTLGILVLPRRSLIEFSPEVYCDMEISKTSSSIKRSLRLLTQAGETPIWNMANPVSSASHIEDCLNCLALLRSADEVTIKLPEVFRNNEHLAEVVEKVRRVMMTK